MKNEYGWEYTKKPLYPALYTHKKRNAEYWDELEARVEEFIRLFAQIGGVTISDPLNNDADVYPVKVLTEQMLDFMKEYFPQAEYPYVDEDL